MTLHRLRLRGRRLITDDDGAVAVIIALFMVMLLAFAALTVDLGRAWAERRQDQTAADAAAMAGAIEYVRSNPTDADVVALVQDYVERNIGYPADDAGWSGCPAPTDGFQSLAGSNCVSIKQGDTSSSDTLLKVRIPDQVMETFFARLIGVDTIAVNASAIARIEEHLGVRGALPFVLPNDAGTEYCLGIPPPGQSRELCPKQSSGNFGLIDSPHFGADLDPWGTTETCNGGGQTVINTNMSIGIDHFLRQAPDDETAAEGADTCAALDPDFGYTPHSLLARQGDMTKASPGLIGPGLYGSLPSVSRLRQTGGTPESFRLVPSKDNDTLLDNVGLWEYLVHPDGNDFCSKAFFDDEVGTELTTNMATCLENGTVKFSNALLNSPRFALVPELDLSQEDLDDLSPSSTKPTKILGFVPVYLQATWYECTATECKMRFVADDTVVLADAPMVFEPGEGTEAGCMNDPEDCDKPPNSPAMGGMTAFVLNNEDWLPEAFDNQFNDPNPYNVVLWR